MVRIEHQSFDRGRLERTGTGYAPMKKGMRKQPIPRLTPAEPNYNRVDVFATFRQFRSSMDRALVGAERALRVWLRVKSELRRETKGCIEAEHRHGKCQFEGGSRDQTHSCTCASAAGGIEIQANGQLPHDGTHKRA